MEESVLLCILIVSMAWLSIKMYIQVMVQQLNSLQKQVGWLLIDLACNLAYPTYSNTTHAN